MDLTSVSWLPTSATGVVALVVFMILTGRLVPRSTIEDSRKDWNERLAEARAEATKWENAARLAQEANVVQADQIEQLMEVARTAEHLLLALPRPPQQRMGTVVEVRHALDETT